MLPVALFLIMLCTMGFTAGPSHDFHVSRCEIHFRPDRQSLEIAQQIFVDDFEEALKSVYAEEPLHLGTELEHADADQYILQYIRQKFAVTSGGEVLPFDYIGKELSEDLSAMWIYLEVPGLADPETFTVEFGVLLELFDDQKNILSFQVDKGRERMFLLDISKPRVEIPVK